MNGRTVKDYYIYMSEVNALANGASLTDTVTIEADSDFVLVKMAYFVDLAGAPIVGDALIVPLVNITINDSGSGRNLQNKPVPIDCMAGRGLLPFVLPVPRKFRARSSINFTYDNYSAGTTYTNVRLALIGYKTFAQ